MNGPRDFAVSRAAARRTLGCCLLAAMCALAARPAAGPYREARGVPLPAAGGWSTAALRLGPPAAVGVLRLGYRSAKLDTDSAAYEVDGAVVVDPSRSPDDTPVAADRPFRLEVSWLAHGPDGLEPLDRLAARGGEIPLDEGRFALRFRSWAPGGRYVVVVVVRPAESQRPALRRRFLAYRAFEIELPPPVSSRALPESDALVPRLPPWLRIAEDLGEPLFGKREVMARGAEPIDAVRFLLDGELVVSDAKRPFVASIDFGPVPLERRLRAVGLSEEGDEVATDERRINLGLQRFSVDLRVDELRGETLARVLVHAPAGRRIERVELFRGARGPGENGVEMQVASLTRPPFETTLRPDRTSGEFVRAVATLDDGRRLEDVRFLDPAYAERVEVEAVELFASVTDRRGRFIDGLEATDFVVRENGVEQRIDTVSAGLDHPLYVVVLVDVSGSMTEVFGLLKEALADCLDRLLRDGDLVSLLAFRSRVEVLVPFTRDVECIRQAQRGLRPRGGTTVHGSLAVALRYLDGLEGKNALVLLTDGEDRGSEVRASDVRAYAQSLGVGLYVLGIGVRTTSEVNAGTSPDAHPRAFRPPELLTLKRYAAATGGLFFDIERPAQIAEALQAIESDLRSQYRIVYHSSTEGRELRKVEVVLAGKRRGRVRTRAAYYP